jgi:serine/threonine protein kinase
MAAALAGNDDAAAARLSPRHLELLTRGIDAWVRSMDDDEGDSTEELADAGAPLGSATLVAEAARGATIGDGQRALELRPGLILRDRYLLGVAVARGGQSIVFRARDLRRDVTDGDQADVAIKVLRDDRTSPAALARLRREVRQTQALHLPGVVRMFDLDCDRGTWFIVMELLEGVSLRTRLMRGMTQPLLAEESLRIASVCAGVLSHAHGRGIVHGDFKPGNVFLEEPGDGVRVLDFGAAADIHPAPPRGTLDLETVSAATTRTYASPEVLQGLPADPRDDLFSLACVTYEMLAGRHPFGWVPANEARARALEVAPLEGLSPVQNAALARGLAWTRDGRPATVADWLDALVLPRLQGESPDAPAGAATTAAPRAFPWGWAALGAVALMALLPGLVTWQSRTSPDRAAPGTQSRALPESLPATDDDVGPSAPGPTLPAPAALEARLVDATDPSAVVATPAAPTPAPVKRKPVRVEVENVSLTIAESAPAAVVMLRRIGDPSPPLSVTWRLADGSALAGDDYARLKSGTARFRSGQMERTIFVPLVDDATPELEEFFTLQLSSRTVKIGGESRVVITIRDDD